MGTCIECNMRHPNFYCQIEQKWKKSYEYFFDYFLGCHAIQCDDKECVCRASTFMDLICESEFKNSKRYGSTIEEVLNRDKRRIKKQGK